MILTAEQKCLLWLSSAEITAGRVGEMIAYYGSAQAIWDAFGGTNGPVFRGRAQEILEKFHSRASIDDLIASLEKKSVHLLFSTDEAYPQQLSCIQDPPYLLYCAGRLSCLQMPMIALVGTRRASRYGMDMAAMLTRGLCEAGICVVSGLARGIDSAAHQAALDSHGHTVGVLGSGIDTPYPPENTPMLRKIAGGIGLVISEYPLGAEPVAFHFPHRNRIISGLSMGVVFVEGKIRSGGMHTVNAALDQGREVFAVPGHVGTEGSEGPHMILREGARLVTSAQELLEDLGLAQCECSSKTADISGLTLVQQEIVSALRVEPLYLEELAARLNADASMVMGELANLEIVGWVCRLPGNRFGLPLQAGK